MNKTRNPSIIRRSKNLLSVGPLILLTGIILEGLTVVIQRWFSLPISLTDALQIILSFPCIGGYLFGIIWFHRSLKLLKVNFRDKEKKLITKGPFNYVRHPLYSTTIITIPPLFIIWFTDLLFFIPWALIIILSHSIVPREERELIDQFGDDYRNYQRYVPPLIPYKGSGGKLYRKQHK